MFRVTHATVAAPGEKPGRGQHPGQARSWPDTDGRAVAAGRAQFVRACVPAMQVRPRAIAMPAFNLD